MVKADRYTADGCEELNKAREADVKDRRYNIGEISEKTGLQKTANGWVKPKNGKQPGAKNNPNETINAKSSGAISSEADSPEARKNYEDFMKEHKNREFQELYGDAIKFDEYGLPSKETIELKNNFLRKEGVSDPNKLTNKEFNELAKKIDEQFGINNLERSQELLVAEAEETESKSESKPAEGSGVSEPKHTLEVGSEVKFKRSGQPIKIKKIENYGGTPVVVGEYDYNGKKETNRFRLNELEYDEKEEKSSSENKITVGNTVKFKKTGQPIKIKDIKNFGGTQVIEGEYEHNGKTETNLFRMDEISTDSAPRVLTGDCRIRVRKA